MFLNVHRSQFYPNGDITTILLSDHHTVLIDTADLPLVVNYYWHLRKSHSNLYAGAQQRIGKARYKVIWLHRLLMSPKDGEHVDHIDHNGLNNRRSNLRIVTHQQNTQNRKLQTDSNTGHRNISIWSLNGNPRYVVQVWCDNRRKRVVKYFPLNMEGLEQAKQSAQNLRKIFFGEFAQ